MNYVKPFFVVEMPLNSAGEGPCLPEEVATTTWQIWDQAMSTVCECYVKETAESIAKAMNDQPSTLMWKSISEPDSPIQAKTCALCEVCHLPATSAIADIQQTGFVEDNYGDKWQTIKSHSIHCFCDNHARNGITYDVNGNVVEKESQA